MNEEVHKILRRIVEVRQCIYDRYVAIKDAKTGAASDEELDECELDLLDARLALAKYEAGEKD